MARKPDSDMINRRLRMNGASGGTPRRQPQPERKEQGGFPFEFAAIVGAVMLTVGIGSYIWFSGGSFAPDQPAQLASVVDPKCRPLWVDGAKNTPGLVCYLTTQPERLCDPNERAHLASVVRQYRLDRNSFDAKLVTAGFQAVAVQKSQMSMEDMKTMSAGMNALRTGSGPSPEQTAAIDKHFNTVKQMEDIARSAIPNGTASLKHVPDDELAAKFRKLAAAGYISKGDFGWFVDPLVEKALANLDAAASPCT